MKYDTIREEELKNKITQDYFGRYTTLTLHGTTFENTFKRLHYFDFSFTRIFEDIGNQNPTKSLRVWFFENVT